MATAAPFFGLAYFDYGDLLNAPINVSQQIDRMTVIDKQIYSLYQIFGDGVVSGLVITSDASSSNQGIAIDVSSGTAIFNSFALQQFVTAKIDNLPPNSKVKIYFCPTSNSRIGRNSSIVFTLSSTQSGIFLGTVTTGSSSVVSIDQSQVQYSSYQKVAQDLVNSHRHRGGLGNPSKIDLSSQVKNQIDGARISNIDASQVVGGQFSPQIIPILNHNDLQNIGILTHAQLDTFVSTLSSSNARTLSQISISNRMLQTLWMMYGDADVRKWMINELDYIPGISPAQISGSSSSASIDSINHAISGPPVGHPDTFFYTKTFKLQSPVVNLIVTSTKRDTQNVIFGVDFTGTGNFSSFTPVQQNRIVGFASNKSTMFRIGIKLSNQQGVSYLQNYTPAGSSTQYSLNTNSINFSFLNNGISDTFNFKIVISSDAAQLDVIYTADTSVSGSGWSSNNGVVNIGGVFINHSSSADILFDTYNIGDIVCGTYYYVKIYYSNSSSSNNIIASQQMLIKQCQQTFNGMVQFFYTNTQSSSFNYHFQVRVFSDSERTNLVQTLYSQDSQLGWVVNGSNPIPTSGVSLAAGQSATIFCPVNMSGLSSGQLYFLSVKAWDGTSFTYQNNQYTLLDNSSQFGVNASSGYNTVPSVNNFSVMIQLADKSTVYLNG